MRLICSPSQGWLPGRAQECEESWRGYSLGNRARITVNCLNLFIEVKMGGI